ncbi:MAG: VOC family protein [Oceanospirillaceae bacterium]
MNNAIKAAIAEMPEVVSDEALSNTYLGNVVELAIITKDHRKTMQGMVKLGIGPWAVYEFTPANITDQTYQGEPAEFAIKVCFAKSGNMMWEIMEPLWGPTIFQDYLDKQGDGLQHIAYDCNNAPWDERVAELESRGFKCVQSGKWMGQNAFAFFDTIDATGTIFETYHFPQDWVYPEPDEWYPAPPKDVKWL